MKPIERREGLPPIPDEKVRAMAAFIFEDRLAGDIERIFAERAHFDYFPKGNIAELNPQLAWIQKSFHAQEAGGSIEEITAQSIGQYLRYEKAFRNGLRDEYGRPGFIQTIPSESDSAASQVIHDLECPKSELIKEGPAYKVYVINKRREKFSALKLREFDDLDSGSPILNGTKIVVPLGPWAGHYLSLFVPTDNSSPLTWSYDAEGKSYDNYFSSKLTEVFSKPADALNMAMLYALRIARENLPTDRQKQNVHSAAVNALKQLGIENPEERMAQNYKDIENYPEIFKSAPNLDFSSGLKNYLNALPAETPLRQATILIDTTRHESDPGLMTFAIKEITPEEIYREFISNTYLKLNESIRKLYESNPSIEELRKHFIKWQFYSRLNHVTVPWQAEILLGEEGMQDLTDAIINIDPEFSGYDFSLLHPPLQFLPATANIQPECINELWGGISFGGETDRDDFFDMNTLLEEYLDEIDQRARGFDETGNEEIEI